MDLFFLDAFGELAGLELLERGLVLLASFFILGQQLAQVLEVFNGKIQLAESHVGLASSEVSLGESLVTLDAVFGV